MITLGINAVYHDDAACIVRDGVVIAAAEDERFTHVKHGKRPVPFNTWQLPFHAIDYCLGEAGITMAEVDHVAYSFHPDTFCAGYKDGVYHRIKQIDLPNSLGLLYEDVTHYLGFLHSSDEYKVMALASYGEPRHIDVFRRIVRVDDKGNYQVDRVNLEELFGP